MKILMFMAGLFGLMHVVQAEEIIREHHYENVDFSRAQVTCEVDNGEAYLQVSVGDIDLWTNRGLKFPERQCYTQKFALEDHFKIYSQQKIEITEVEITRQECDRRRECHDVESAYQVRAAAVIAEIQLSGYARRQIYESSEPVHYNPHEGCEYYGKLGGGWVCD